jgi:Kelch motif/Galactose oxidase, central domain
MQIEIQKIRIMKIQPQFLSYLVVFLTLASCTKTEVDRTNSSITPLPPPPTPPSTTRNMINAQLISAGNLSQARSDIAVASSGNKLVFAGGYISPGIYSSRVDIFDTTTNSWVTAELSQARRGIATAVLGKKIYFAGGNLGINRNMFSSRVDIYNTETNTWTTAELGYIGALLSGAAAGNKVVFASGVTAHIYDTSTNAWTTAPLSERPGEGNCCQEVVGGITATVIGNTIYFAGGLGDWEVHKAIDIYNATTNTWSTSSLSEYKGYAAGIAVGNTNYWGGGYTFPYGLSNLVEIRDVISGSSTFGSLFQPNAFFSAVLKNNKIVFFTSGVNMPMYWSPNPPVTDKFDIYDITDRSWSIGVLSKNIEGAATISMNNTTYVAGGYVNGNISNQVWKLEF